LQTDRQIVCYFFLSVYMFYYYYYFSAQGISDTESEEKIN